MKKFKFYTIDENYVEYLREFDNKVSYNSHEKNNRPFIGIVLEIDNFKYYAPLSSPKEKHLKMKTMIDFYKIDKGKLGVINLNNMIPVDDLFINKLHPVVSKNMNKAVFGYNTVLIKQLDWCNKHREEIYGSALLLYSKVSSKNIKKEILKRCVDFKLLELKLIEYINKLKEK